MNAKTNANLKPLRGRLLTSDEVADRIGVITKTLMRLVKKGKAPQPLRRGRKLLRWRGPEVADWIDRVASPLPGACVRFTLNSAGGVSSARPPALRLPSCPSLVILTLLR
jgi:predicted DNA-binding transcriptional regulator AlpA